MNIFEQYESNVRSYCRSFPKVFVKSKMSTIVAEDGEEYLDFFSGAGALNYGHNNDFIKGPVIEYLSGDGLIHGLDMYSKAKQEFIDTFVNKILKPRDLEYKLMFCGPTGTNANEAALKIARKITKRNNVISFRGAFHGMTMGSLSMTSSCFDRGGAGVQLGNVTFMPYPTGCNAKFDTIEYLENVLNDDHSGMEKPAAIFLETVQAEGGVMVADVEWLKRLRKLCTDHKILLVVDDVQVGCGRTGNFFSFERAGIKPDMVTLSKSISGYGLPMSLLLIIPEVDCLAPGEHNGTFRGNQLAFIAGKAAIEYAIDTDLWDNVKVKEELVNRYIRENILSIDSRIEHRGIGLIHGIDFNNITRDCSIAKLVSNECFKSNLIIETAGRNGNVLKILPPLVIKEEELLSGLEIVKASIKRVLQREFK